MRKLFIGLVLFVFATVMFAATELSVLLPFGRVAYQTNEQIPVSVVRTSDADMASEILVFTLSGEDGSIFNFTFSLQEVLAINGISKATEHYQLNGALLRPGQYTITVTAYGVDAYNDIEVYSDVRKSNFVLPLWNRYNGPNQTFLGEDGFGFNVAFASYGGHDNVANIRSGQDYIPICVQSGGHQMDLRMECDWSDPNVLRGGLARSTRYTLAKRTLPNFLGTHFYDEPGLTWFGDSGNAAVPAQLRSFENAFSFEVPNYKDVMAASKDDEKIRNEWKQFTEWKATLMDAAWQYSKDGVKRVNDKFMAMTQSQYGWSAFSDGYYFTITRNLDVTSGHGGYDDWGPGYWHPSFTMEVARARDFDKPTWYLPAWYGNTGNIRFRGEQYLSFQTNIQGMQTPPDLDPVNNPNAREGIAESNKIMGRLGTIFTNMPVTRGDVGILFPLSYNIYKYTEDPVKNFYAHCNQMGEYIHINYIATKLMQVNSQFILEEDVLDGTAEQFYKVILINGVEYLRPDVVDALEQYIRNGGTVVLDSLSTVKIAGAVQTKVAVKYTDASFAQRDALNAELEALRANGASADEIQAMQNAVNSAAYGLNASILAAVNVVNALQPIFDEIGIETIVKTAEPGLSVTKQISGDVEYVFVVNAAKDMNGHYQFDMLNVKTDITFNTKNRAIYDAIRGGEVEELKGKALGETMTGTFSMGKGEMRAVAMTKRPIDKVITMVSDVKVETTRTADPISFTVRSFVVDSNNVPLNGSIPMKIRIVDPLGVERYNVYRATKGGVLEETFVLAANDPAGEYKVEVTELLNNKVSVTTFESKGFRVAGAAIGEVSRAIYFDNDRENMKRFFRQYNNILVIAGTSDYSINAAYKFAKDIEPWGIKATVIAASEVDRRPEPYQDEYLIEAHGKSTWVDSYSPAPFDVHTPAVIFGNPDDNPLIKAMLEFSNTGNALLPYTPVADVFPGRDRGMIAWQYDVVNYGIESIVAIAYDEKGMEEARGSVYQTVALQDSIMFLNQPTQANVAHATVANNAVKPNVVYTANVPDRGVNIVVNGNNVDIYTFDGTVTTIDANGVAVGAKDGEMADKAYTTAGSEGLKVDTQLLVKTVEVSDDITAVIYWGGKVDFFRGGSLVASEVFEQDISVAAFNGNVLVAVLATGQVLGLSL